MKSLVAVAAIAFVAVVVGFRLAPVDARVSGQEQIEAEVMEVAKGLMVAWNAEDLEGSVAPFNTENLYVVWGSGIDDTPQAYHDRMAGIWGSISGWEGEWEYSHVKVINENAALFLGRYRATITDGGGGKLFFNPHWTALFERGPDGWKMTVVDHAYGVGESVESP